MNNLFKLLKHDDPNIRKAAILAATYKKDKNFINQIITLLKDKVWQVKLAAIKYFQTVKPPEVLPQLYNFLGISKENSRKSIISIIAIKNDLYSIKNDPSSLIKKEIARTIALIDKKLLIEPLTFSLESDKPAMVIAALSALGDIGEDVPEEPILKLLNSENEAVLLAAIVTAGKIKCIKAVQQLISLSEHKNPKIRKEVIIALNHIKSPDSMDVFLKLIKDNEPEVRKTAVIALGNTKEPSIVNEIIKMSSDDNFDVKLAAIRAFINFPQIKIVETLIDILNRENNEKIILGASTILNKLINKVDK